MKILTKTIRNRVIGIITSVQGIDDGPKITQNIPATSPNIVPHIAASFVVRFQKRRKMKGGNKTVGARVIIRL